MKIPVSTLHTLMTVQARQLVYTRNSDKYNVIVKVLEAGKKAMGAPTRPRTLGSKHGINLCARLLIQD